MSIEIKGNQIIFSSRKKYLPSLSCKLLSLFICPTCNQILKAFFETEKPTPWLKYEDVEDDSESRFDSIAVPGGQGIVNKAHGHYDTDCTLEIYWALNPKANLEAWLVNNYEGYYFRNLPDAIEKIKMGKVAGLHLIADQINKGDFLLGFNKIEWEGEWDSQKESYEKWEKRQERKIREKIDLLDCVRKKG